MSFVALSRGQFVKNPKNHRGDGDEIRKTFNSVVGYAEFSSASPTLKMYLNGMGFRGQKAELSSRV